VAFTGFKFMKQGLSFPISHCQWACVCTETWNWRELETTMYMCSTERYSAHN